MGLDISGSQTFQIDNGAPFEKIAYARDPHIIENLFGSSSDSQAF